VRELPITPRGVKRLELRQPARHVVCVQHEHYYVHNRYFIRRLPFVTNPATPPLVAEVHVMYWVTRSGKLRQLLEI
jgi:hypothetical protein